MNDKKVLRERSVTANRKYKDSVFSDLFYTDRYARENLTELYNALFDDDQVTASDIDLLRLEQTLFMTMHNDVAFGVHGRRIVLSEHQSTINENLPLRFLMYIGREYENYLPTKWRYHRRRFSIPRPEFIAFYNGTDAYPAETTLFLSDSFRHIQSDNFQNPEAPKLELCVKVININPGADHPLLKKCRILREYSELVENVRKYSGENSEVREAAVQNAVQECIKKGILKEYLERKGSEAVSMLIAEYSYEEDVEAQREESWEAGKKEGRAEGKAEGKAEGIRGAVALLREMSLPETEIEERIRNQFCLTDDQARSYMQEQ